MNLGLDSLGPARSRSQVLRLVHPDVLRRRWRWKRWLGVLRGTARRSREGGGPGGGLPAHAVLAQPRVLGVHRRRFLLECGGPAVLRAFDGDNLAHRRGFCVRLSRAHVRHAAEHIFVRPDRERHAMDELDPRGDLPGVPAVAAPLLGEVPAARARSAVCLVDPNRQTGATAVGFEFGHETVNKLLMPFQTFVRAVTVI